ncbi:MAG TPA: enoyl-CoA hydratase-related protein [Deinococcales bacterium]|nr:enoyl-CoA hydratase-related protein [Deinococcales bacterium]
MTTASEGAAFQAIAVERPRDGVALVRLNRPKQLNALNQATMSELVAAFDGLAADDGVRAVVLTGSERAFAAGADIAEFQGKSAAEMLAGYRFTQWQRLREFPKPVVAAVQGLALGGGLELAMLCDVIVAAENARFGQPEINLGLMPGAGGTQRLTRAVGKSLAMEMVLNARMLSAREALQAGLVSRVVPSEACLGEALELAREIAARAPVAVRLAKASVLRAFDTTLDAGLAAERHDFYLLFSSEDAAEGIAAFLEKRRPNWRGR